MDSGLYETAWKVHKNQAKNWYWNLVPRPISTLCNPADCLHFVLKLYISSVNFILLHPVLPSAQLGDLYDLGKLDLVMIYSSSGLSGHTLILWWILPQWRDLLLCIGNQPMKMGDNIDGLATIQWLIIWKKIDTLYKFSLLSHSIHIHTFMVIFQSKTGLCLHLLNYAGLLYDLQHIEAETKWRHFPDDIFE